MLYVTHFEQVADAEDRRQLMKQFAAEREAAKARILEVGNQLLTLSKPVTSGGGALAADSSAAGAGGGGAGSQA